MNAEVRLDRQKIRVRARKAVLRHIQAFQFLLRRSPQADRRVNQAKNDDHAQHRIDADTDNAETLDAQLTEPAAVEKAFCAVAFVAGKQADRKRAPDPVYAVYGDRADRIVHMEAGVQHFNRQIHKDPRADADDKRADGIDARAARRNGDQTGEGGVQAHGDIRFAVLPPGEDHAGDGRRRGRDGGGPENPRHFAHIRCRRPVEAVPGEPENEAAQGAQGDRVARNGIGGDAAVGGAGILPDPGSEYNRAHQRRQPADHMNHAGTRKVDEGEPGKPAASPYPSGFDGIDDQADDRGVQAVRRKPGPLRHGAGDDGCRGRAEDKLEDERGPVEALKVGKHPPVGYADQAEPSVVAHHQTVAEKNKNNGADAEVHQILHDDVAGVLCPGKARLDHGKPALHEEHQNCADKEPD